MITDPLHPRKLPKQERSRSLFDAVVTAAGRILPRGLEPFTSHDIADRAGVSIGSLYQYFPSKEAIVGVFIERRARADAERVRRYFESNRNSPVAAVLRQAVTDAVEMHRRDRHLYTTALPLVRRLRRHRLVRTLMAELRSRVAEELSKRQDELRKRGSLELPVFMAGVAIESTIHAALEERPELLDDPRFGEELADLVERYLVRDPIAHSQGA